MIERLLLERISLRGICRVIGVGLRWLLQFMVERFTATSFAITTSPNVQSYPDSTTLLLPEYTEGSPPGFGCDEANLFLVVVNHEIVVDDRAVGSGTHK